MSTLLSRPLVTRKSSGHDSVPVEPFDYDSKEFLQSQHSLPKMPIPSLESSCEKYLSTVLPLLDTDEEKAATKASIDAFLNGDGPILHQHLIEYDEANSNYIEHFYREIYTGYKGSNFSLNPNFVLQNIPGCDTAPKTAAALTMAALRYHTQILDGTLPIMQTRAGALCMRQASWVFGTARIPQEGIDNNLNFGAISKHIVVFCRGLPYQLTVLGEGHEILADETILQSKFSEIIQHAKEQPDGLYGRVGALTTGARPAWFNAREKLLVTQAHTLAAIDSALFVVAIDLVSGLSDEEMELNCLYGIEGTYENRWMDKWTMIICEDGKNGLNWEHSMLDGHTMMEFYASVGEDACKNNQANGAAAAAAADSAKDANAVIMSPLSFTVDNQTQLDVEGAVQEAKKLSNGVGIASLEYEGFGSSFIKKCKCSPDAFVQMALNLTYYEYMNKLPAPYESVLTKAFKHGRVTVARNMSEIIAMNTKKFNTLSNDKEAQKLAMTEMCKDTSRICKDAATAQEFDRPFLAYRKMGAIEEMKVPFADDYGWSRLSDLGLCTSQCGKGPIKFFGFEPPSNDGFSIGYCIQPDNIQAMITHFNKTKTIEFTQRFEAKLNELKALFE
jgi:carnitine O-acetyltransferase